MSSRLADLGMLPKQAPVAVAETPAVAPPAQPEPAAPAAETAAPVPPAAPATQSADIKPSFDLLRAEPDGSIVIAGSGKPGSDVHILMNGNPLGKTKVETNGDWAFVPDKPLPPGGVELTLGADGADKPSDDAFVVVIDPDHKTEPLVVASTPGKMSEVLQGLDKPAAPPVAVATAEPPAPAAQPTPMGQTQPQQQATATPQATPPVSTPAPDAAVPPPVAAQTPAAQPEPGQMAASIPPAGNATPPSAPSTPAPATEVAAAAPPTSTPLPQPTAAAPQQVAAAQPSIDAIEIDEGRNFFAGAGPEGAAVRLYVDSQFIGDGLVAGGRWLIETERDFLSKPAQLVRIDVLKPQSTEVASRAEVNFVVDMPAAAPSTAAQGQTPAPVAPAAQPAPPSSQQAAVMPEQPVAAPGPQADQPEAAQMSVAEQPQPQAEENIPTMVAEAVGDPEDQRFASGKAIIRHGDNLWTIARRVYGYGIKYTTIYTANSDQIRDPDRIYPGQVFALPKTAD